MTGTGVIKSVKRTILKGNLDLSKTQQIYI